MDSWTLDMTESPVWQTPPSSSSLLLYSFFSCTLNTLKICIEKKHLINNISASLWRYYVCFMDWVQNPSSAKKACK